jgi:hypothetical protein
MTSFTSLAIIVLMWLLSLKVRDHLRPEGSLTAATETAAMYEDKKSQRPIIRKLVDHSDDVQPRGQLMAR